MTEDFIDTPNGRIHYKRWGHGPRLMIAFHGFSNRADLFSPMGRALEDEFRLIAIDLPFHGQTQWSANSFNKENIKSWIQVLLQKEDCSSFDWMGFSLGCRIILSLCQELEGPLRGIHLIAPDGLATYRTLIPQALPAPIRSWLHRDISSQPSRWLSRARRLHQLGILDLFTIRYFEHQLRSPEQIQRLFGTWISLVHFPVKSHSVRQWLIEKKLPLSISLGLHDKFINSSAVKKWAKPIPQKKLVCFNQGHHLVNKELSPFLKENILSTK